MAGEIAFAYHTAHCICRTEDRGGGSDGTDRPARFAIRNGNKSISTRFIDSLSFDPTDRPMLTSRCAIVLMIVGLLVGVLFGLFGIGSGFVIVSI